MRKLSLILVLAFLSIMLASTVSADQYIEKLKPNQKINGFKTLNVYDNAQGQAMGARFMSEKYGFTIDLLRIQSVPQAFMWVKSAPSNSMGRPHACEHLLLGKGNLGRYVSAQEDMMLSNSSAFTMQTRTCYHFNTVAGADAFYEIFEAKLNALINPDFTDEEIMREVCHIGVLEDQETGELSIDEKGTVYTEMVSGFEKPWYYYGGEMNKLVFGENHPLALVSGGDPDVMRDMNAQDMWDFIANTYHLANMGVVVSIPDEIEIESFLKAMDKIMSKVQKNPKENKYPGMTNINFPPQNPAPKGTVKTTTYPSDKDTDFGYMVFAWPSVYDYANDEELLMNLFWTALNNGQTSNMYNVFINSETQQINLGAQYVYGGLDDEHGISPYFGIGNLENRHIEMAMIDSVGAMITDEIKRVANFEDNSESLAKFNKEVMSQLIQQKKQIENYLNSPPMFGFRSGAGAGWLSLLGQLEKEDGFRKSLLMENQTKAAEDKIASGLNIWKDIIAKLNLLTIKPYAIGSKPDPNMINNMILAKEKRIEGYLADMKKKYGVDSDAEAIAIYKKEFDANSAELDAIAANQTLPDFIENPPFSLDEQLKYETFDLENGVPMFASTFENMTSSTLNLYLKMNVIPESLLVYLPLLNSLMTDIGVIENGVPVKYEDMTDRLRKELLNLNAYYTTGNELKRIELVLSGQAGNLDELNNVIHWIDLILNSPYLSVDNLPRINDVINQSLGYYRNRTKGSEENWVNNPANSYRYQNNPLYLATGSFLTEKHFMQRLKWQFTMIEDQSTLDDLLNVIDSLESIDNPSDREGLITILDNLAREGEAEISEEGEQVFSFISFGDQCRSLVCEVANELKQSLSDIPDENLADDWKYLCGQFKADLKTGPKRAFENVNTILDHLRSADIARMVMVSNSSDREKSLGSINKLIGKLNSKSKSVFQNYSDNKVILANLKSRTDESADPIYVGLKHEGTRNGVLIFNSKVANQYDTSTAAILNCLAGKLYSGGGPHGFFMNTWAAGLAYSNGYNIGQASGRNSYYAERCPDVAETMRFVVNLIQNADPTPDMIDYAIALIFANSRAQSRYESRGLQMASNFEDGITPDRVKQFRKKVFEMRSDPDLFGKLKDRMQTAYGPVMIGYGEALSKSRDGVFFLIGPDQQFESLEKYIESTEGKQTVYKLYPRDFWLKI